MSDTVILWLVETAHNLKVIFAMYAVLAVALVWCVLFPGYTETGNEELKTLAKFFLGTAILALILLCFMPSNEIVELVNKGIK